MLWSIFLVRFDVFQWKIPTGKNRPTDINPQHLTQWLDYEVDHVPLEGFAGVSDTYLTRGDIVGKYGSINDQIKDNFNEEH